MSKKKVAIFIFNDVEVLDFAGPFEVFSVTSELDKNQLFEVYTVAEELKSVTARNGLSINPSYEIADCPTPNILIIPGGFGTRELMNNSLVIQWVQNCSRQAELVLSVCTGSLILAKAGLLVGLEATTHHLVIDDLRYLAPTTQVLENQRFVDNGQIITAAGISAGIDMCLYVVSILLGKEIAEKTAKYMEYKWEID
ncbi:MAG: DJ-1/PfpI family protein [Microcoleaceae cyanobacterium MO_207.B10]|nr:DJ-1/PfpI family protein [Microcoleaceae cyanobacterium MO_207.B10]